MPYLDAHIALCYFYAIMARKNNWGFIIKSLREAKGFTQEEFAKLVGIKRSILSHYELGYVEKLSQDLLSRFAKALDMTPSRLSQEIYGKPTFTTEETPEQILERLKLAQPISIPVYTDFPFHAGTPVAPIEYVYRARTKTAGKHIEGYLVKGTCLEPVVHDGDTIIVDREGQIDDGDIIACVIGDELHIGRLRKITDELWLENNNGRYRFEECAMAAPVIEVTRRLK